jgi:hypothetical protein
MDKPVEESSACLRVAAPAKLGPNHLIEKHVHFCPLP